MTHQICLASLKNLIFQFPFSLHRIQVVLLPVGRELLFFLVCLQEVWLSLNHRLSEGCPGQGSSEFSGPSSKQLVTESLSFLDLGQESKVDLTHLAGDCDVGCKPNGWKSKSVPSSLENLHQVPHLQSHQKRRQVPETHSFNPQRPVWQLNTFAAWARL